MGATLLIMAAGMGSRYGGNKQVDGLGPNGEILMEYSICLLYTSKGGKALCKRVKRGKEECP